ncbi:MAG: hypothetical protein BIFFINMI_01642 [Phycisphaerae bacterium]|nr:hypothetical protein [Phycisphaerae bacterium]
MKRTHAINPRTGGLLVALLSVCLLAGGCGFSERGFPMHREDVVYVAAERHAPASQKLTRVWLERSEKRLDYLLDDDPPMLTDDLTLASGRAADVFAWFDITPSRLPTIWGNWGGLRDTAQSSGVNRNPDEVVPDWPGFEQVWIPVDRDVKLSARLGLYRRDGVVQRADCIVIEPGFYGGNNIRRTEDLSGLLMSHGFHVLAIELRGHGQTEASQPEVPYTFGLVETGDLLAVSEWLTARPDVRRTGLMGFSWGANSAILAGWYDGGGLNDPDVAPQLRSRLRSFDKHRHFQAGIMVFSPVVRFERFIDRMDRPQRIWREPAYARLQAMIRQRMDYKHFPNPSGSLHELIAHELTRSPVWYDGLIPDAMQFMRTVDEGDAKAGDKLGRVRVPMLIVQAADDPIGPAQEVADLISTSRNPNVAAIVLPGGGHVGFAAYRRSWFYSLIVNFFDASTGPVAVPPPAAAAK